jgi:ribosomal protein S18 acetylase RimI-like enzyme
MHFDLLGGVPEARPLADGYQLIPWSPGLLEVHARVKHESFRNEIDAHVFPSLAGLDGCRLLMKEIAKRANFVPRSTWLISHREHGRTIPEFCATIQGLRTGDDAGSIQNVGVVPQHRGRGLGPALLVAALQGFLEEGLKVASLEVTAQNRDAIQLYLRFGFEIVKPVFKSIEIFPIR